MAAAALEAAAAVIDGSVGGSAVGAFFFDPDIPAKARSESLVALYGTGADGSIPAASEGARQTFARFVDLLVEKGRVALIPAIARSYRSLLDREAGIERASLVSARPLPSETVESIRGAWKKASGASKVEFTVVQDPALIGGFVLRTDSVRYDWSVAGRVKRLGQELSRPLEKAGTKRG
jgi:F0F1-type ATP synthase delta subunit